MNPYYGGRSDDLVTPWREAFRTHPAIGAAAAAKPAQAAEREYGRVGVEERTSGLGNEITSRSSSQSVAAGRSAKLHAD